MQKKHLIFLFICLFFLSCGKSNNQVIASDPNSLTIGTFNVAWLGDGNNDTKNRTEDDYKRIASIIKETGADVLAMQEIENSAAMQKLVSYLPGFDFVIGEYGKRQNLAILFKKDVKILFQQNYTPLIVSRGTRPGLVLEAQKGNFHWLMMAVHFKSSSHYDKDPERSFELRSQQADAASLWADSVLAAGKIKNLIILGDFNDTPQRQKNPSLSPLLANKNLSFLTFDLKSCKFKNAYAIDHIVVSKQAEKHYIPDSRFTYNFYDSMSKDEATGVSDHCPVTVKFDVQKK